MELEINVVLALAGQVAMIAAVIQSNRTTVNHLKEQNKELKDWLTRLQDTVNELRVKVGE